MITQDLVVVIRSRAGSRSELCGSRGIFRPRDLTNCASYATLAKAAIRTSINLLFSIKPFIYYQLQNLIENYKKFNPKLTKITL